jgi:hypothetical protein
VSCSLRVHGLDVRLLLLVLLVALMRPQLRA